MKKHLPLSLKKHIVKTVMKKPFLDLKELAMIILKDLNDMFFTEDEVTYKRSENDVVRGTVIKQDRKKLLLTIRSTSKLKNNGDIINNIECSKVKRIGCYSLDDILEFLYQITENTSLGIVLIPNIMEKILSRHFQSDYNSSFQVDEEKDGSDLVVTVTENEDISELIPNKKRKLTEIDVEGQEKYSIGSCKTFKDILTISRVYSFFKVFLFTENENNLKSYLQLEDAEKEQKIKFTIDEFSDVMFLDDMKKEDKDELADEKLPGSNEMLERRSFLLFVIFSTLCKYLTEDIKARGKYWESSGSQIVKALLSDSECSDEVPEEMNECGSFTSKNWKTQTDQFIGFLSHKLGVSEVLQFQKCFACSKQTKMIQFLDFLVTLCLMTDGFRNYITENMYFHPFFSNSTKLDNSEGKGSDKVHLREVKGNVFLNGNELIVMEIDGKLMALYKDSLYLLSATMAKRLYESLSSRKHNEKLLKIHLSEYFSKKSN